MVAFRPSNGCERGHKPGVAGLTPATYPAAVVAFWKKLANTFTVPTVAACPAMTRFEIYLEGPGAGIDIFVDDAVVNAL